MRDEASVDALFEQLVSAHNDISDGDFLITCGGQEWKVHGFVLRLNSSVLAKAVDGDFKETAEQHIDLPEDAPTCIDCLVRWCYTLDYAKSCDEANPDHQSLAFHTKMAIIADKYDISQLKTNAIYAFEDLAKTSSDANLAEAASIAYEAYAATMFIRTAVLERAIKLKALSRTESGESNALALAIAGSTEFATDYATALEKQLSAFPYVGVKPEKEEVRYTCPDTQCNKSMIADIAAGYTSATFYCYWCGKGSEASRWRRRMLKEGS